MTDDTSGVATGEQPIPAPSVAKDVALSKVFNGQGTAGVDFPHAPGCPLDPDRWPHSICPNPEDRCSCVPDRAGWISRADGKYVHQTCGLRSVPPPSTVSVDPRMDVPLSPDEVDREMSDGDHDTRASAIAAIQGRIQPNITLHRTDGSVAGVVGEPLAGPVAIVGAEMSVPAATVQGWPGDWVMEDIKRAQNCAAVVNIRTLALSKGAWNPEVHEKIGKDRYMELQKEGKLK
jgi:hypothetical protein